MKRYDSYKDSGVKWLGEIPSHWEVKRLGSYFTERKVKVSDKEYEPLSVTKLGVFPQWENVAKTNDGDNRKLVKRGDFVINSRSDRKGSSGVSDRDGSVSLINIVLQPRKTIIASYTNYLLKSYKFIEEYYRNGHGIVADLWTTRFDEMKMIKVAIPSIKEQEAIANYLDAATSKIDEAIAQQQKMIDLLNERKQIIINNAVTKGLNSNAPMKDSGIDWIGQVPKHWRLNRLKTFLSIKDKRNYDAMATLLSVYTAIGVKPRAELEEKGNKASTVLNYKIVNKGDLIVNRLLAWMGAYGISNYDGVTSPDYDVYSFKEGYHKDLYEIMFRNTNFKSDCYKYGHGIMMMRWRTYPSEFLNILVPIPPYEEQKKIYDFLSPQIEKMNEGIEKCNNLISLLQERKQIIVNDVVTGKVKVV